MALRSILALALHGVSMLGMVTIALGPIFPAIGMSFDQAGIVLMSALAVSMGAFSLACWIDR